MNFSASSGVAISAKMVENISGRRGNLVSDGSAVK